MSDFIAGGFEPKMLDESNSIYLRQLPSEYLLSGDEFDQLWESRPDEFATMPSFGRVVKKPRWEQAYGRDYRFAGATSKAIPMTETIIRFREWCREAIDTRVNGALLNWYDASLGHYMGLHHDKSSALVAGSPIITISFGEARVFRMQNPRSREKHDVVASHGLVIVIPFETNLVWKHAVPRFVRYTGRRISLTFRAFRDETGSQVDVEGFRT